MKKRLTALALALLLVLSLCACTAKTGEAPAPTPAPDPAPTQEADAPTPGLTGQPTAGPEPSQDAGPEESQEPDNDAPASATPEPSQAPSATPAPSAEPTPEPTPEAEKTVAVADVYAAVSRAAGASYDNMTSVADAYYTALNTGDVAEYVLYMPSMSAVLEEIFIARANPGKAGAVKAACAARQADLAEEAAFYGENGRFVESYQLVTEGDWVLFCVGEKASSAVSAFRSAVK